MDVESRLRLEQHVPAVEEFLASTVGRLVRRPEDSDDTYWVVIQPRGLSGGEFIVRLVWTVYPQRPPSLLFADSIGGVTTRQESWPAAEGYRAPNDVCKPFTAEGQALHAEWGSGPHEWRGLGNPFLYVVETVQGDIDRVNGRRAA